MKSSCPMCGYISAYDQVIEQSGDERDGQIAGLAMQIVRLTDLLKQVRLAWDDTYDPTKNPIDGL